MRSRLLFASTLCLAAGSSPSLAATATGVLTVQATVVAGCSVTSGVLAFGTVNPAQGTVSLPSVSLSVTCTSGTNFSVGLGDGANVQGTQRRMKGSSLSEYLNYELYKDVTESRRFGDATTSERMGGQIGLGALPNMIPVYGKIPSGQSAPADVYSDTVPITVYY